MVTQDLINFITEQLNSGRDEQLIRKQLLESNWQVRDIDEAFVRIHFQPPVAATTQLNHMVNPLQLIVSTWFIYKKKWKLIVIMAVFFKMLYLPLIILQPTLTSFYSNFFAPASGLKFEISGIVFLVVVVIMYFLYSSFILGLEITTQVQYLALGFEKIDLKNLFKKSFSLILPYWWLTILQIPILMGGFLFFFVPGLIFSIWFYFSVYILVLDSVRGINSLFVSREIVKERFWQIAGRIIVIGLITGSLSLFISIAPKIIAFVTNPQTLLSLLNSTNAQSRSLQPISFNQILQNFILILIQGVFIFPFANIYNILLYKNAKQAYAKSFPMPSKKSKLLLIIPSLIIILLVVLSFIFLFYLISSDPLKIFRTTKYLTPTITTFPTIDPANIPNPSF